MDAGTALGRPAHVVLASRDQDFVRLVREQLRAAGLTVSATRMRGEQLRRLAALRAAQLVILDADSAAALPDDGHGPPADVAIAAVGPQGEPTGVVRFIGKWSSAAVVLAAVTATLDDQPAADVAAVRSLRLVHGGDDSRAG